MARFFLDRPVFAWVISILIMLLGLLAFNKLAVTLYPSLNPPVITISTQYRGASADAVKNSVTSKIEQNLTGIEGMRYFSSSSTNDGNVNIAVYFNVGVEPEKAYMDIQNKVQGITYQLPDSVRSEGINVSQTGKSFSTLLALTSTTENSYGDIGKYINTVLIDDISRVPGVARVHGVSPKHAMRIWLDPLKLARFKLSPSDIVSHIQTQNSQVASGYFGESPTKKDQQLLIKVNVRNLLKTPAEFGNIVVKNDKKGGQVKLKDVARIEVGYDNYINQLRLFRKATSKGKPMGVVMVYPENGTNIIDMEAKLKTLVERLQPQLPQGMELTFLKQNSPKIKAQLGNVLSTLVEAVVLVFLVMYLFLQSVRATLIPSIAVPIVLLGTLSIIYLLGFSINTFTMYALILAIGLLVDDAIVVVENVERLMHEQQLTPYQATKQSMDEISSALIGIGLSISAVFMPMAFMPGSVGVIFQQFSITLITAMLLSVVVAMTLTPVLCATLLKPSTGDHSKGFFGWFNKGFNTLSKKYEAITITIIKRSAVFSLLFLLCIGLSAYFANTIPSTLIENEESDTIITIGNMKPNTTIAQAREVSAKLGEFISQDPAVADFGDLTGFNGTSALAYIKLKDIKQRNSDDLKAESVVQRIMTFGASIKNANVFAFTLPELDLGGSSDGVEFALVDSSGQGPDRLLDAKQQFFDLAANYPALQELRVSSGGDQKDNIYQITLDQDKLNALNIPISRIDSTINIVQASLRVNDYLDHNQIRPVIVMGESDYRMDPDGLMQWYVKNTLGEMVSFKEFTSGKFTSALSTYVNFNGKLALEISTQVGNGYSSGEAINAVEDILAQLPPGYDVQWTGSALEEKESGSLTIWLYALSGLFVFLVLAALYESWTIPFSVILAVPFGVLGAFVAIWLRGINDDLFFKVAIITTMALTAKNAILIVEFAKQQYEENGDLIASVAQAVKLRLRPIIMTSMAFGLGVVPLVIASGVGSVAQHSIGTAVLGGMLVSTFIGTLFVPMFFVLVVRLFGGKK